MRWQMEKIAREKKKPGEEFGQNKRKIESRGYMVVLR